MDRYRVIAKFAKQHNWKQGLELGVWVGVTTFFMMRETDVTMYCVDSWEEQPDNPEYDWQFNKKPRWKNGTLTVEEFTNQNQVWDHKKNEKHFRENAEQGGDRIKIIKGRAREAFGKGYNVMGKGVWYAPRYNNITITRPVA